MSTYKTINPISKVETDMKCICQKLNCKHVKTFIAHAIQHPQMYNRYSCALHHNATIAQRSKDYIKEYVYQIGNWTYEEDFLLFIKTKCPNRKKFKILRKLATI